MGAFHPKRLVLTDFMAHKEFTLEFRAPLTFIIGRNDTGKTSILNALEVLTVGKARGVSKQDRAMLGRGGKFALRAEVGDMVLAATAANQTPLVRDIEAAFASGDVMKLLLDGASWAGMNADQRRRMLNDQIVVADWRYPMLPGELEATRRSQGPQAALRKATEGRRRYEAMMREAAPAAAPQSKVTIRGKELDLTDSSCSQFNLSALIKQRKGVMSNLQGQLVRASVSREKVRETLEQYRREAEALPQIKQDITRLEAEKARLESEAAAAGIAANEAGLESARVAAEASRLENQASKLTCSECGQAVTEEHRQRCADQARQLHSEFEELMNEKNKKSAEHRMLVEAAARVGGQLTEAKVRYGTAMDAQRMCAEMASKVEHLATDASDPEKLREEIRRVEDQIEGYQEIMRAQEHYAARMEEYQRSASTNATWKKHRDDFAAAEAHLQEFIASGAGDAAALLVKRMAQFVQPFGWSVELDEDLLPSRDGIPFGLNCKSNRAILLAALQYGMAMLTGVLFFALDDYDALDAPRRDALRKHLGALCQESSCMSVVLCASDKETPDTVSGPYQIKNLNLVSKA